MTLFCQRHFLTTAYAKNRFYLFATQSSALSGQYQYCIYAIESEATEKLKKMPVLIQAGWGTRVVKKSVAHKYKESKVEQMLFSSNFFLYLFLPVLLIVYYFVFFFTETPVEFGNIIILEFSIIFYLCTGGRGIFVLLFVILFNFICALILDRVNKYKTIILAIGVMGNLGVLAYYKYSGFIYQNYIRIANIFSDHVSETVIDVLLPVGISFFTFQAMSYMIDVYREEVSVQKDFCKFALYIVLFPQLIAGPIVRYKTICNEINKRTIGIEDIYEGSCRFILGLGKKVLIADTLGSAVDAIWGLQLSNLTSALAWSAAFLYTLQIYYDFSGYSDMAIGLGRMFGFHIEENFVQPYISCNLTEFWRRWHISLSSFLKDYLYIPLGGNRGGTTRTYRNLLIVFIVCGLWHGAGWSFVVWGIYHGMFLIIERVLKHKYQFQMTGWFGRIVTFFVVMIGWIPFRSVSLTASFEFLKIMFGNEVLQGYQYYSYGYYVYAKIVVIALVAFIVAFVPLKKLRDRVAKSSWKGIGAVAILLLSMLYLSEASFTPFIYFQF